MDASLSPGLMLTLSPKSETRSDYDWMNIYFDAQFVGKIRARIKGKTITIYTITIFPEFQAHGCGKQVIDRLLETFDTIIADRVRYTAIGFWEKMDFLARPDGCYELRRKS